MTRSLTNLETFLRMVPSPSSGIGVIFLNLKPPSSANCSRAWTVMLTNLLLEDGNCRKSANTRTTATQQPREHIAAFVSKVRSEVEARLRELTPPASVRVTAPIRIKRRSAQISPRCHAVVAVHTPQTTRQPILCAHWNFDISRYTSILSSRANPKAGIGMDC